MSYELEATVYKIGEVQTFKNDFTKRDFVVKTDDQYPQVIAFELVKDKTSLADKYNVGDKVKVSFDLRGREWEGRFFTSLNAWRIESVGSTVTANATPPAPSSGSTSAPAPPDVFDPGDAAEDDLPF
jgi:hypothetical protein